MKDMLKLAQDVLRELHEPVAAAENPYYPYSAIFQALNAAKDDVLREIVLTSERYRTLLFPTDTWAYFPTPASGNRIGTMPANFVKATLVEVLVGSQYFPIEESRPVEGRSWPSPFSARSLSRDSGYYFEGDGLFLDHDCSGVIANGVRVRMERDCPDLLVGQPATNAIESTGLVLAQTDNLAIGQMAASMEDHDYLGLYLTWIPKLDPDAVDDTQAALLNTRKRIVGYAGTGQVCTMDSAWTDPPLPLMTDTYAMQTPFPRAIDRVMVFRAASLLRGNAGEDPSVPETNYRNALDGWLDIMETRSSAQRRVLPYEDDPD